MEITECDSTVSSRNIYIFPLNATFPQDFGRQVLCEGLNLQSKLVWKNSMLDEPEKVNIVKDLKSEFRK